MEKGHSVQVSSLTKEEETSNCRTAAANVLIAGGRGGGWCPFAETDTPPGQHGDPFEVLRHHEGQADGWPNGH